ncbi:MAG: IclR family transcriptional regulator [Albidovulum sp.]|nr:IclR family transcriptional regulator [Albidovulum sp.]MDE0531524.1 IclR family transcriptional regulator [Albidovulum sp.]
MTSAEKDNRAPYRVNSLIRALAVLGSVVEKGYDISLAEVVNELRLPKATAFRYLQTLVASGYLRRTGGANTYTVGPRFLAIARESEVLRRLRKASRSEIERVATLFGQTVNLGVLADDGIVYIDMVESRRHPEIKARVGGHDALHATSLGKAILAHLPEEERRFWLAQPLTAKTLRTITSRRRLERELALVSERGYAVDAEENEDEAMCVGVPILCGSGYPVAAMSLTARTGRRTVISEESVAQELSSSAAVVSSTLEQPLWLEYVNSRSQRHGWS